MRVVTNTKYSRRFDAFEVKYLNITPSSGIVDHYQIDDLFLVGVTFQGYPFHQKCKEILHYSLFEGLNVFKCLSNVPR